MSCAPCEAAKNALNKSNNILQGYSNLIFKDNEVEKVAKARYDICLNCSPEIRKPLIVVNGIQRYICTKCTCPLDAKVRAPNEVCPIGNW